MITLNSERGLERIESWDDILALPGFKESINPKTVQLETILGSYVLPVEVPCGLTECRQPHRKGFLVKTTVGDITNLGNVCGKNNFGVDFETLRKRFDRDVRIKTQKETLKALISRIPTIEEQIAEMRSQDYGADWVNRLISCIKTPNQGVPEQVRAELLRMLKVGDARVYREREATKEELDAIEVAEGRRPSRGFMVREPIGSVDGLGALAAAYDLREILVKDIDAGLDRISYLDIEAASEYELARESKWAGMVDAKLDEAEAAISLGRRLLVKENFTPFEELLERKKDVTEFQAFIAGLPSNAGS